MNGCSDGWMDGTASLTGELIDEQRGKNVDGCTGACVDGSVVAWLVDKHFFSLEQIKMYMGCYTF
jgi:hypothetical protein